MLLKRRESMGAVGVLAGAAVLAHGISAAALPVLSRLYTPSDFAVLASFSGLLSVISVAASLRYDLAVPMPKHDVESLNLLVLAILLAVGVSLVLWLFVMCGRDWLTGLLRQPALERFLPWLPLGVAMASSYSALQSWFVRRREFPVIASSRVAQSTLSTGVQVAMGWLTAGPLGLVIGQIMNTGAACLWLGARVFRNYGKAGTGGEVSWQRMKAAAVTYNRFPKYSTAEALCNSGSIHVPVVMIAAMATAPEAGYVMLGMALLQAPMSLVGSAIGQVYLSRAPAEYRAGSLGQFTAKTLTDQVRLGVGPLIAAGIISPVAFEFVFGEGWQRAGVLVSWMTPWFVMQFLASPISMALHVTGRQKHALALQAFGLAIRVLAVLAAAQWLGRFVGEAYAVSGFVFYFVYLVMVLDQSKAPRKLILQAVTSGLPYLLVWAAVGIALAVAAPRILGQAP